MVDARSRHPGPPTAAASRWWRGGRSWRRGVRYDAACQLSGPLLALLCILGLAVPAGANPTDGDLAKEFAFRDGDTVAFLGDSITAARTYGEMIEVFSLLRFPERRVRFINAGVGGDTAVNGLRRLERDVLSHGATVLTVMYGYNDILGSYAVAGSREAAYVEAIEGIVKAVRQRGVRVYVCSAPITVDDPESDAAKALRRASDAAMARARQAGAETIDVSQGMRRRQAVLSAVALRRAHRGRGTGAVSLHADDGIHLNELGHFLVALTMLEGLGASTHGSSAVIDAETLQTVSVSGCTISDLTGDGARFAFARQDRELPFSYGPVSAGGIPIVPTANPFKLYTLAIRNLASGKYAVTVDGYPAGAYSSRQLEVGVNLAQAPPGGSESRVPWNVRARMLRRTTEARHYLDLAVQRGRTQRWDALSDRLSVLNGELDKARRTLAEHRPFRIMVQRIAAFP